MNNWTILYALNKAPEGQLNKHWKEKCKNFHGSEKELMQLFADIYNTTNLETSKFLRTLVDPMFTKRRIIKEKI